MKKKADDLLHHDHRDKEGGLIGMDNWHKYYKTYGNLNSGLHVGISITQYPPFDGPSWWMFPDFFSLLI